MTKSSKLAAEKYFSESKAPNKESSKERTEEATKAFISILEQLDSIGAVTEVLGTEASKAYLNNEITGDELMGFAVAYLGDRTENEYCDTCMRPLIRGECIACRDIEV